MSTYAYVHVSVDTPVSVLVADSIILRLPVSPDVSRVANDLAAALQDAADRAGDERLELSLDAWANDDRLHSSIAAHPVEMFDNGTAAATATPMYDVQLDADEVTIVVTTVELIPGYGSTASSREHEDGHALINKTMTLRCAKEIVAASIEAGNQGNALIADVLRDLDEVNDPVHNLYHKYVDRASYGQHMKQAERALDEIPGCDF